MNPKEYLTIRPAAKVLGVSPQTLRNWTLMGEIKCLTHPVNRYRYYKKSDLDKLLQQIKGSYE